MKIVSQHFFPDTALAGNQHPRVCRRDKNSFIEEIENGTARTQVQLNCARLVTSRGVLGSLVRCGEPIAYAARSPGTGTSPQCR